MTVGEAEMSSTELSKVESYNIVKWINVCVSKLLSNGRGGGYWEYFPFRQCGWYIQVECYIAHCHTICWSCAIWNTFGPIAETVKAEYGWSDGTLSQFTLWAVLDFPLFFLPSAYLLSWSLRCSVLVASVCCVLGSTIRWQLSYTLYIHRDTENDRKDFI